MAFDSDCREAFCGTCSLTVNGEAHGPKSPQARCAGKFTCKISRGETITVELFPRRRLSRSGGRSHRTRRHRGSWRIHLRARRGRAGSGESISFLDVEPQRRRRHALRRVRSGVPEYLGNAFCGKNERCETFAAAKSIADPFGHAAAHAPQPMHAAASIARSASCLGTRIEFASGAEPARAEMNPPACTMRSSAMRSTARSLTIGNAPTRNGSTVMVSPSRNFRI